MTECCGGFSKTQKTTDISFLMEVIMITAHEAEMRVWWWVRHDIQSSYGRGMGWCDLLTTRPSSFWLGFKSKHVFQIRRLPQNVAKQQLQAWLCTQHQAWAWDVMFVGGHGRSVCHLSLGSENGITCLPGGEIVPAPGLFGHNSWRVAQEGTCEPPHCPRYKPSLGGL